MTVSEGKVYLIDTGPGDPNLVTLRARELIQSADVIVYDYLTSPRLLDWASDKAEKCDTSKLPDTQDSFALDQIYEIFIDRSSKGLQVVRLKNGDPLLFARGDEEMDALENNGIAFEVVPGVTAGLAAAYSGIPLSHRDCSASVTFLTGHGSLKKQAAGIDFRKYGKNSDTLCLYVELDQLQHILDELKEGGMPGTTPIGVIQWATLNRQCSVYGTIDCIAGKIQRAEMEVPAMVIIGEVVARRSNANWFEDRPLFGKRIFVACARRQATELVRILESQGAEAMELPLIEVKEEFDRSRLVETFTEIAIYEWIIFTSANGVNIFFDLFYKAYRDIRCLGPMRVVAIGSDTVREIEKHPIKVDLVSEQNNVDALATKLIEEEGVENTKMLFVTGNQNEKTLAKRLESEGRAIVDILPLYKTSRPDLKNHPFTERYRKEGAHAILFINSLAVEAFMDQQVALKLKKSSCQPVYGSMDPATSKALKASGCLVDFEASQSSLEDFVLKTIACLKK